MTKLLQVTTMLAVCALVLSIGAPAMGALITTADGAGADNYIFSLGSGANNTYQESDSTNFLFVKNAGTYERSAYLKFDLSSLSNDVATADLETMIGYPGLYAMTVDIYGVNDSEGLDGWDTNTITWNNAPANDTTPGFSGGTGVVLGQCTYLGTYTHPVGTNLADLTTLASGSALVDFLNADTDDMVTIAIFGSGAVANYNVAYMGQSNTDVSGGTTGITHSPTLNISEVPEPSALVLLTAGLIGLVCYAWRKRK